MDCGSLTSILVSEVIIKKKFIYQVIDIRYFQLANSIYQIQGTLLLSQERNPASISTVFRKSSFLTLPFWDICTVQWSLPDILVGLISLP